MPYSLLGQQTKPTPYTLLQDSATTVQPDTVLGRIGEQTLFSKYDPQSNTTVKTSIGDAVSGLWNAMVVQPAGDLKALAEVQYQAMLQGARAGGTAEGNLLAPQQPDALAISTEQMQRAQRGAALGLGMAIAGPTGSVIRSLGARAALNTPMMQAAPRLMTGIINTGAGLAEGAAFGVAFGALKPLDESEDSRGQAIAFDAIAGAFMGSLFGGIGAIRKAFRRALTALDADTEAMLGSALREATKDDAAAIILNRQQRAQLLPEPLEVEEIAARVAAGATEQGASRQGLLGRLASTARTAADAVSIRFPSLKRMDSELHTSALKVADASTTGAWFGRRAAQFIENGMSAEQKDIFWRGLIAARGRQIRNDLRFKAEELATSGETIRINGKVYDGEALLRLADQVAIPSLLPMEEVAFTTNPIIRQAVKKYSEQVLPLITDIRTRNGLTTLVTTDQPFVPLVKAAEADIAAGLSTTAGRAATGGFGSTFSTRVTPGAKMALGQAQYLTNGEAILSRVMGREFAVDRKNEFIARVINAPWARRLRNGEKAEDTMLINGVEEKMAVIDITGNPRVLKDRFSTHVVDEGELLLTDGSGSASMVGLEGIADDVLPGEVIEDRLGRYLVPRKVAQAWNELFNPLSRRQDTQAIFEQNAIKDAYHKFMDFNVGLLLASPVEVTAHSSRILSILSRMPGVGDDQGALQRIVNKFVPWFGPRLGGLRGIYNLYDNPAAMAMEARLAKVPGALPSRAFESEHQGGIGAIVGGVSKPAARMLEGGRKFIFDLPDHENALHGFDIRARITAAMMAERIAGRRLTDAELSEFLTQFGTYSEGIQSNLASWLRRARINPFAGGQAGIIPAEIRGFFGSSNLPKSVRDELGTLTNAKLSAEVLWRGTIGTVTMMSAVQKALTDRWPWENEPGHEEDLMVGYTEDGRGVYIPFHTLAPDLARAARITGARALAENLGPDAVPQALLDMANTAITYTAGGPGTQAMMTLATGNAPFITGPGAVMQVVPPQPTAYFTMKERFLTAAGSANPTMENILGVGGSGELPGAIRIVNAITPGMEIGRTPLLRVSAELRGEKAQFYSVVEDRVTQAFSKGLNQGERLVWYRQEMEKFPPEERVQAFRQMIIQDRQRQASTLRNAAQAIAGGATPF